MRARLLQRFLLLALMARPLAAGEALVRYEASHNSMATDYTVVAYGQDRDFLAEVVNEVFEEIDRLDAQLSNYKPESELSQINRNAAHESVVVEPGLFKLIQDSLRYSRETNGSFDITVGPLMKAWGFFRGQGRIPTRQELDRVLQRVGYQHVKLDSASRTVRFDEQGIDLDLGGIAKGYAVDRAVALLRENGVASALVSSGTSSIYALGAPPGDRAWKVTLRDPFDGNKVGDVIGLRNYSMSTSANYERFFKLGGKTYGHIMDPRTGMPTEGVLSVAVFAPATCQSDALTKPFFILGVNGIRKYLDKHAGLMGILYLPGHSKTAFTRVITRSSSYRIPPVSLVDIEGK